MTLAADHRDAPAGANTGAADASPRNGIDSIDVELRKRQGQAAEQAVLLVHTFRALTGPERARLGTANVRLLGRGRSRPLAVTRVELVALPQEGGAESIRVTLPSPRDGLTYTLSLVDTDAQGRPVPRPFPGFDPFYAHADFTFRNCLGPGDCAEPDAACPMPDPAAGGEIDYLAKDFASFLRLLLDRMAQKVPDWTDRLAADQGATVAELVAYVADQLSYYQDAVGTEAYLDTARRRISVRRHARLVDYRLHEGCNARAWVCLEVEGVVVLDLDGTYFYTDPMRARPAGTAGRQVRRPEDLADPLEADRLVFAPVVPRVRPAVVRPHDDRCGDGRRHIHPAPPPPALQTLHQWHNRIRIRAHGHGTVCLPRGATSATLIGPIKLSLLQPGAVLIFEEVLGPGTGNPADADPTRRHAVRLTHVIPAAPGDDDVPPGAEVDVVWFDEDALPFPVCLSSGPNRDVSVARGNVVLADHGQWAPVERLQAEAGVPSEWCAVRPPLADRFLPLGRGPVTHASPLPDPAWLARLQADRLTDYLEALRGRSPASTGSGPGAAAARQARALEARVSRVIALVLAGVPLDRTGVRHELEALAAAWPDGDGATEADDAGEGAGASRPEPNPLLLWSGWDPAVAARLEARRAAVPAAAAGSELYHPLALGPARDATASNPRHALPALGLAATRSERCWTPRADLLSEPPDGRHVVVEVDDRGRARLRFDDDTPGAAPAVHELEGGVSSCDYLEIFYRFGNGAAGNVGAGSIAHAVGAQGPVPGVSSVRNPLAAAGGTDPEPVAEARAAAPSAFRDHPRRAVTADDYARLVERDPRVQRAAGVLVPTPTGLEARVAIDLKAEAAGRAGPKVGRLYRQLGAMLERYRLIGHDVRVVPARAVPLDITLEVCIDPGALEAEVVAALRRRFSARADAGDGKPGFFHPDRMTFGQSVARSVLQAEAAAVPGVSSVEVVRLRRLFDPRPVPAAAAEPVPDVPPDGLLTVGPMEIPQLDPDSQLPERGRFQIRARGGR